MPIKLRITLLFTTISIVVLFLMCGSIYYISYTNRRSNVETRLTNRAITTARLLSQSEFNPQAISKVNELTASALKNKSIQAYDQSNKRIYFFSDNLSDTIPVNDKILEDARNNHSTYFRFNDRDVAAHYFTENNHQIVIISAAFDELGEGNLQQLFYILLIACIGGIIVSFISGYFFSTKLLQPVKKIADKVNDISAHNLATRLPEGTVRDEWHYLNQTLNRLLNRLQDSFEMQRRFISNASHELSTPLTAISSQLDVYLQKDRDVEDYKKVMHSLYQDVQHMNNLTRTLLEFAKTAGNAGGIELNHFRIDELLLHLPAEIIKIDSSFSIDLSFHDLPENETALFTFGNEGLLFTAIRNLVVNACKYSPDKHAIVELSVIEKEIHISIQDNGPGISPLEVNRIFEPFYRSENQKQVEGFGLGLSLSSRIVKLHKGEIKVSSGDKGSCFKVILPASAS